MALARDHGVEVIKVYRDTKKYRVRGKLVDPSGTRADRPGLVAMLRDAAAGKFDVILAWREHRLYQSVKPMWGVFDTIKEHKIDILLAREIFDPTMMTIKAWVAQMKLDGMRERMTIGIKARLRAGKANIGQDRYGYKRNGEIIEIVEEEAKWVRKIFEWYNVRVPINEIRNRLIEAGAPQKVSSMPRKIHWARSSIQAVLQSAKVYATGIKIHTRAGEAFEIPVPKIITTQTYNRYLEVREMNTKHPARNLRNDYLIGGLIYCPCERKWAARLSPSRRRNRKGVWVERKTRTGVYWCTNPHRELVHPDCPRTIGSQKADNYVWDKVCEVLERPDFLIFGARQYVEEIKRKAEAAIADNEQINSQLDAITMERQWVITQARKGKITDEDMDCQLGALREQEISLKR